MVEDQLDQELCACQNLIPKHVLVSHLYFWQYYMSSRVLPMLHLLSAALYMNSSVSTKGS